MAGDTSKVWYLAFSIIILKQYVAVTLTLKTVGGKAGSMYSIVKINIPAQLLAERAVGIFMDISGINQKTGSRKQRMTDDAFRVHEIVHSKIEITAECRYYEDINLQGSTLTIAGSGLSCSAFELIDVGMLEGVYLYVISAGDTALPKAGIREQLYADLWGNAYIDAARSILKEQLQNTSPVSDSFGPGFYGMATGELTKMGELLDFKDKGILIKNGQIMIPLKTCTGIIFKVNDTYRQLHAECASCRGSHISCNLCDINRSK